MAVAINNVLPNTCYRLYEWHIEENAVKRIPHLFQQQEFGIYFKKLMQKCESETDFQFIWQQMVDEFNIEDNDWLKKSYGLKEKQCPRFNLDVFSGDNKSVKEVKVQIEFSMILRGID